MIHIQNALTIDGTTTSLSIPSEQTICLNASGLLLLPGLIDPHVHFRTPGLEHKEDWCSGARASIKGGYTTVFDMPNTDPPTVTAQALLEKKARIEQQLAAVNIPLRYYLFLGADKQQLATVSLLKDQVIGIKVFMGCSTGGLLIDDDESLHALFKIAAEQDLLVAVHAEDEARIRIHKRLFADKQTYSIHSQIRDEQVAVNAVRKAITLAGLYGTRLYLLHVSTCAELELIADAKDQGLPVFAETTPHHLFLNQADYTNLQGKAVMNPPLRTSRDQQALWHAIRNGIIDTLGSDHAPHTLAEKAQPYEICPAGVPGIETSLPLLLDAQHKGLVSLKQILRLTTERAREIFKLPETNDYVLVNPNQIKTVIEAELQTKCAWSPFAGRVLQGWPVYVIVQGRLYDLEKL